MGDPDGKLISKCKKHNRDALNQLFQQYENYIYKICYYYSRSNEDAMDLMQEVFIKIYRSIEAFKEGSPVLPWIKRITVNTCLNFIRGKPQTVSLDTSNDDDSNAYENLAVSSENVESIVICSDTKKHLENSIRQLPAELRMAVILRHVKGMTYDEISRLMKCPLGTVKTYIYRGREALRKELAEKGIWEV